MMKRYLAALVLSTALVLPFRAESATLADSVGLAISSHPMMEAGRASANAAGRTVWEQRSNFFPSVGLTAQAGREHADNDTTRGFTGGSATSWVAKGGVTVTQPVFAGFGTVNRSLAAESRYESARLELGGVSEDIALKATRAHLNLMRTRELLDLASAHYDAIQQRHDSIALMVREGAADEAEQFQAVDALMSARNTRLGYEEAWHQAEADYIEVVGDKPGAALEFGASAWDSLVPPGVDEAVTSALASNPRVLSAGRLAEALGREEDAVRGDFFPRLDTVLSYDEKDQHDDMGGESKDAAAMLRMSWNFSAGGAELARIARGADDRIQASARQRQAAREVEHDVRQKFTSMTIVDEQFVLLAEREQEVQKILSSFLKQFEGGKQTNLQLIAAHSKLFDAKAGRADAYYRKLLSRFELLSAMGRLREAFGLPEQKLAYVRDGILPPPSSLVPRMDMPRLWSRGAKPAPVSAPAAAPAAAPAPAPVSGEDEKKKSFFGARGY